MIIQMSLLTGIIAIVCMFCTAIYVAHVRAEINAFRFEEPWAKRIGCVVKEICFVMVFLLSWAMVKLFVAILDSLK